MAVQHEAVAVGLRGGRQVGEVEAALRLGERERAELLAGDQRREVALLLRGGAGVAQEAAGEHDARQIGLDDEAPAELLEQQHQLHGAAAEAAVVLGEGHREPAELGELAPVLAAEAFFLGDDLASLVEVVLVLDEALDAVLQQGLLVAKREIHRLPLDLVSARTRERRCGPGERARPTGRAPPW